MAKPVVWLLLLLQALAVAGANWNFPFGDKGGRKTQGDHAEQEYDFRNGDEQPGADQPYTQSSWRSRADKGEGAEYFNAALKELRTVPKSSYQHSRRPSGLLSTALHYVAKTIPTGPVTAPTQRPTLSRPVAEAVDLLQEAALRNNSDAIFTLAEMTFYGHYGHPRNLPVAYQLYDILASVHGNATAQYMVGVFHSTGLAGIVPQNQANALLYHTFAAAGGDLRSEMAVAYRHYAGIGAVKSCERAVEHYKRVADKAIEWYRSGPPGGRTWVQHGWRIADDHGGVYGEGASASSAGINAFKPNLNSDANAAIGDVIEYLDLMSQKGDYKAAFNLGRIYYEGQRGLDRNLDLAKKYFFTVAARYWKRDGRIVDNYKPGIEKTACKAAAYIGRMYLRGEGLSQNFEKARTWFERGVTHGDPLAQYGLGRMLLLGHGGHKNFKKAMSLLKISADQDFAPAQVEMGKLRLDQGTAEDLRIANNYFELASRYGNIEANYYLAEMVHHGVGREKLCPVALNYYKNVAEKAEPMVASWAEANEAYNSGDHEAAFLHYLLAAEQGYEKAQTNVAYLLDSDHSKLPLVGWLRKQVGQVPKKDSLLDNASLALVQWTRSSRQSNIDATVKMGDYYYYGIGTERDIQKAVQCYLAASDHSQSAQALFNLGWMHENGVGLDQDFHLAKRYYDHALMVNKEAYLPVTLSLLKLRVRSAWNTLTDGDIHSIQEEPSKYHDLQPDLDHRLTISAEAKKDWSLSEWIANFIQEDAYYGYEDDMYADDLYDDTIGGGEGDFDEGGVLESVLIIGVMTVLIFLLWWRQRIQQAHAQREEERRREQGLPPRQPPPAGPNPEDGFAQWAAGGIEL
ncbi:hypothetical protein ACRE_036940 [Hapsidospora chrysogenum ATCC 11550]|uniref:Protein sel-1-like protein n=1 Tax=Hapsidospora chrysogenum (strain ATCC 11550 / CBS 779.69 / DSM 880 / IAM 14645 / JCM 23072 / IMI 49137) TaxID=857340 RepID=A0A086T821_HAPC1|nr:hypothetical protein ACRE_036940 [Hapsidospora chrysogenum ATCC 11550]